MAELFLRGRPANPDAAPLLVTPAGHRITYAAADRRSAQLASALRCSGVGPGDRVVVQIEKSPDAVMLYLACLRSGAVIIPINTAYVDDEVARVVDDADPALFVGPRDFGGFCDLADNQPERFDDVAPTPEDVAAILYTSGTTGRPKGAVLTHRNLAANADALCRAWGFTEDDVVLHALPLFHAHGLFVAVNCVVASGASMDFLPRFDVHHVLAALPRCSVMMGVPTFYTRLLAEPAFDASACAGMRLFISGSAPLRSSTHREFVARTGHAILERYGMTETLMLTTNPLESERRAGTVGLPLSGTDVRISDPDGGGTGSIEVRGPSVFAGYWRRPELAATEFSADGWFRTGDVGRFDDDGYLSIVGRTKDLVISGGLNVYPKEVEDALDRLAGVAESAVIGVPDPDFGEVVVAVVVASPGVTLDAAAVRAGAAQGLAGFKVPKRVEIVDALPRNAMGKVEKAQLRQRFGR